MISIELFLTIALITSIFNIKSDAISIKCDYRKHSSTGCEDNAVCDQKLKQCICRIGYAMTLNGECLQVKAINESCISSMQCRTLHSACLAEDGNYDKWKCQCLQGFWFDEKSSRCLQKYSFGNACRSDLQCRNGLICVDEQNNNNTHCKCPLNYRYNATVNECQHLNNNGCPDGQQWNEHNNKCEPTHYSNRSGVETNGKQNAIVKNSKLTRQTGYWTTAPTAKDEDTDEKILEIILEISFLIVCLLAYQACSKACCPDDSEDDVDVKSDEESMISTTNNFKKSHRRVRKVFCKSRANSTQRLIGTPVHKYKNIIVKFDDNNKAQCYNCKIYKEVYSPTAKCKVCRTSITAEDETSYSDGKSVLLPLPPYKLKPIRRSEEVGVPEHLRYPYVNNQPFWLK